MVTIVPPISLASMPGRKVEMVWKCERRLMSSVRVYSSAVRERRGLAVMRAAALLIRMVGVPS